MEESPRSAQETLHNLQETLRSVQETLKDVQGAQQELRDSIRLVNIKQDNVRIASINSAAFKSEGPFGSYYMLKKVVPGDGWQLASAVAPNDQTVPDVPLGQVGKEYAQNLVDTSKWSHTDVLAIIPFYNESFCIEHDENELLRVAKIVHALIGLGPP
ncbi:hypothetical protein B0H21DRAFT_818916 [Amylocystis lapponica]|nr:hypothetical protein B0H21DRAFT_818916 [Amylocystis lapponica]